MPSAGAVGKFDTLRILPVFASFHADFIMRSHLTMWKAPGGLHCGGWCRCLIHSTVTIAGREVTIGGYTRPIEQPALGGREALACDEELQLSGEELVELGERASKLSRACQLTGALESVFA